MPSYSRTKSSSPPVSKHDYEVLADFRYQLRKFLRVSEEITRKHGVTPLQYMLLLHIKGFPNREWATVGELAERLQAKHHGIAALITRCEKLGLVGRSINPQDRRQVEVRLLEKGEALLAQLAALHRSELLSFQGKFTVPDVRSFSQDDCLRMPRLPQQQKLR
jgi:DNA-binding MarR family transcriptional regulator